MNSCLGSAEKVVDGSSGTSVCGGTDIDGTSDAAERADNRVDLVSDRLGGGGKVVGGALLRG